MVKERVENLATGLPADALEAAPPGARRWGLRAAAVLLVAYLLLVLLGYLSLRHRGVMVQGQELAYDRAMFLSVNCATLTGFQQSVGASEFNRESAQGPLVVLSLVVLGSLFTLTIGGLAAVRALRLPYTDGQVVIAAMTVELVAVLVGTAGLVGDGRTLYEAVQMATCAFGNCGSVVGRLPDVMNWRTHCLLLPLAALGGLGLPVLMEVYDRIFGIRKLSIHSRAALATTTGVYLVSLILLLLVLRPGAPDPNAAGSQLPVATWREAVATSSAAALDARTAGFPFDQLISHVPRVAQWIVAALMVLGACSAGTGGGIKLTTFYVLFGGLRDALTGRRVTRAFGIAGAWLTAYALVVLAGFLLLLASEPQMPADRIFFLVLSAAGNVGLSHDMISIVGPGLYILSLLMLLGRFLPLLVLWWLASSASRETHVLVG